MLRLVSVSLLLLALCAAPAFALEEIHSISYTAISADGQTVYFSYWGDIWSAPRDGSTPARRLTDNVDYEGRPLPSPDGKQLAFLSDRFGSYDIFVMSEGGGKATRLTWDSGVDYLYDWNSDGTAVLEYAKRQDQWGYAAYAVPLDGSQPQRLTGPDHDGHTFASFLGSDDEIVYARDPGNWTRKHYRGSFAYDLWMVNRTTGKHTQLTEFEGKDLWPQPSPDGKQVYFVSDRDGTDNIWELTIATGKFKQLTHFKVDGPRWPRISSDGDEIACEVFGEFYVVPTDGGKPEKVDIYFADDSKHEMAFDGDISNQLTEKNLSPNGSYFAVAVMGDIYLLKNPDIYEDDAKPDQDLTRTRLVKATTGREMQIDWHPDSTKIAYLSDRDGQFDVYLMDLATLEETQITDTPQDEYGPDFAPVGDKLAYYSDFDKLMVYDLEEETEDVLMEGTLRSFARANGYEWSPDGLWLAYTKYMRDDLTDVFIMNIEDRDEINVSRSPNWNGGVVWSPDGKYLAWTDEAYYWEAIHPGDEVMLLQLDPEEEVYDFDVLFPEDMPEPDDEDEESVEDEAEAADETVENEDGSDEAAEDGEATDEESDDAESDDEEADEEEDEDAVEPITIDLDRIHLRAQAITYFEGSAGGPMFDPNSEYILFESDHGGEYEWWTMTLEDEDFNRLGSVKGGAQWSPDGNKLYYLDGGRVGFLEMSGAKSKGGGSVSMHGAVTYEQHRLWDQMLVEGWRYLRDYYYDKDMHGVDWEEVLERYRPRVQYVGTANEYGQLYREMLGEINSSHINYSPRTPGTEPPYESTASFGVLFDEGYAGEGWQVAKVINDGPADRPGSELFPGDVIIAINGEPLAPNENRAIRLRNLSGTPVRLTVVRLDEEVEDGGMIEVEVPIKPVAAGSLRMPLYDQWVEDNRAMVDELSGGRLAYQHIRSMNHSSLIKFRKELFAESVHKDALVLDIRFNGGGSTSVAVTELLTRTGRYLRVRREDGEASFARQNVFDKPVVLLINAHCFSNAEILAHILKDHGIATVIGETTGGNVISTGGIALTDGSRLSMPGFENARLNGIDMEGNGNGAVPDIYVHIDPEVLAEGRDNQIEAAVDYLLKELK